MAMAICSLVFDLMFIFFAKMAHGYKFYYYSSILSKVTAFC